MNRLRLREWPLQISFEGIAKILSQKADLRSDRTFSYEVSGSRFGKFNIYVEFDKLNKSFIVLQIFDNSRYCNIFCVNAKGEIVSFCDHAPNASSLAEVILSEDASLPSGKTPFDLKFCTASDPVAYVKEIANQVVKDLENYGVLNQRMHLKFSPSANDRDR